MSEAEIKACKVTPIHRRYTHIHSNKPSSVEGRRLMKWARDYWRDGFSVWTSDEGNVNSVHVEGRGEGEGLPALSIKQTKHLLTSVSESVPNALNWSVRK